MNDKLLEILQNLKDGNILRQENEEKLKKIECEKEKIKEEQLKINFIIKTFEDGLFNLFHFELQDKFYKNDENKIFLSNEDQIILRNQKLKYIESLILKENLEKELNNNKIVKNNFKI